MGGGIGEDPHLTTHDGRVLDFMGQDRGWYALFSHRNLAVNIRTDYLKTVPGVSKVGAVAVLVGTPSDPARIMADLGEYGATWTLTLPRYNPFASGLTHPDAAGLSGSVTVYDASSWVEVSSVTYVLRIRRDWAINWHEIPDPVPHLDLWLDEIEGAKELDFPTPPHGILGQSFPGAAGALPVHPGGYEGAEEDYRVSGPFAVDFKWNRFGVA